MVFLWDLLIGSRPAAGSGQFDLQNAFGVIRAAAMAAVAIGATTFLTNVDAHDWGLLDSIVAVLVMSAQKAVQEWLKGR